MSKELTPGDWALRLTQALTGVLAEVVSKVGEQTVWPLPTIEEDKREEYIAEMACWLATVAMSDARSKRHTGV